MADDKKDSADDDTYVIEDTGETIEEIEHEMEVAAQEAAGETPEPPAAASAVQGEDEARDRYLRVLADFDNYRKRTDREKADFFRYALANVMKEMLPVLDNFDRALEHAEEGDEFHKGVLMIYKQLFDVLQKHGLKPIDEAGVRFNPNIHEAVVSDQDASVPSHTVVAILQRGYFLHDRLLRPALVKVAVGGPEHQEQR